MFYLIGSIIVVSLLYQSYVTYRVVNSSYFDISQVKLQLLLIWLIPIIGAALCHMAIQDSKESEKSHSDRKQAAENKSLFDSDFDGGGDDGGSD